MISGNSTSWKLSARSQALKDPIPKETESEPLETAGIKAFQFPAGERNSELDDVFNVQEPADVPVQIDAKHQRSLQNANAKAHSSHPVGSLQERKA